MKPKHDIQAMAQQLREHGFDAAQERRFILAFDAAKMAVVWLLCARYGTGAAEMLQALRCSRNLGTEVQRLVERMEVSPAFVRYIHSGLSF
jgi:hypothetical protein